MKIHSWEAIFGTIWQICTLTSGSVWTYWNYVKRWQESNSVPVLSSFCSTRSLQRGSNKAKRLSGFYPFENFRPKWQYTCWTLYVLPSIAFESTLVFVKVSYGALLLPGKSVSAFSKMARNRCRDVCNRKGRCRCTKAFRKNVIEQERIVSCFHGRWCSSSEFTTRGKYETERIALFVPRLLTIVIGGEY